MDMNVKKQAFYRHIIDYKDFLLAQFQNSCDEGRKVIAVLIRSGRILGNILYWVLLIEGYLLYYFS